MHPIIVHRPRRERMPPAMLRQLIWSTLYTPEGGRVDQITRLPKPFAAWQPLLRAKSDHLAADYLIPGNPKDF